VIDDHQTLLSMFNLASTKWAVGEIEKQRHAIQMISQLADQLQGVDALQLGQLKEEVSEKKRLWQEQLSLLDDEAAKREQQPYDMLIITRDHTRLRGNIRPY